MPASALLPRLPFFQLLLLLWITLTVTGTACRAEFSTQAPEHTSPGIKTVLFYPGTGEDNSGLHLPPVVNMSGSAPLRLEFDELADDFVPYYVKIVHCNSDWSQSILSGIQYLNEYNEYPITEYEYSFNTYIKYIHYTFMLPPVKVSGNYVMTVYKNGEQDNPIITRRFIAFEQSSDIHAEMRFVNNGGERFQKQQIAFNVNYGRSNIPTPFDVKAVIRQNARWDNAKYDVKPLYIQADRSNLDYNHFDGTTDFWGVNEYRLFDTRSVRFKKFNVAEIELIPDEYFEVSLMRDLPRNGANYLEQQDMNGNFYIEKWETGNGTLESDYVWVNFFLDYKPEPDANVYVIGKLNEWQLQDEFRMVKDPKSGLLRCRVLLKQGVYNYGYMVTSPRGMSETKIEGSHSSTGNIYDIIVYYRFPGGLADRVIGYTRFNTVNRP